METNAKKQRQQFNRMFPTERRCWEFLRRVRWPHGFRCPRCEGRKAHRLRARGLWQCAVCRYQASTPFSLSSSRSGGARV